MDERRVQLLEPGVVEAEAGEPADPEVLDENVRVNEHPAQDRLAAGRLEVEPEGALVPVDREVIGRGAGSASDICDTDPRWPPASRGVTLGRLDLDDVRAQVAEEHRAIRPGEDRGAVDDAQPREGARRGMIRRGRGSGHRRRW
jgi:hypothetical protein